MKRQFDADTDWVIKNKALKDRFQEETDFLKKDRTVSGYRYEASVGDLIDRTKKLQTSFAEIHEWLWNFDEKMASKFIGLNDIEDVIKVGRFGELSKRDILLLDLEEKAKYISQIIDSKEV